jgi:hypothetical protein
MDTFNGLSTSPVGTNGTGPNNIFGITQSWSETVPSPLGFVTTLHDNQDEFYDGEFSGSYIKIDNGELNEFNYLKYPQTTPLNYNTLGSTSTTPSSGYLTWQSSVGYDGSDHFLYVSSIYINETDLNGNSIETALSNLSAGNKIKFTVSGSIIDLFTNQYSPTVEGLITSIVGVSPSVWRINLSQNLGTQAIYYIPIANYPIYTNTPGTYLNSSIYLDPYINNIPNFYNSDSNPTINNINADRLSSIYEEVTYYPGITTPTNFDLIISGSAIKAAVQDSNYTSKRITDPRYNGVKATNKYLNIWTPGDTGNYGKTPSTQNLKTMVAYCDWISGWPPERENASTIHIQYMIKSDGTIVIPDISENSLFDNKGTFESGEKLIISSKTLISGQPKEYRNIIRGGSRIESILYTQSGSAPNIFWNTTMSFTDVLPPATSASADYSSQFVLASTNYISANSNLYTPTISSATHGASYLNSNGYQVPLGVVQDAISLTFNGSVNISLTQPFIGPNISYNVNLSIWRGTTQLYFQNYPNQTTGGNYSVTYTQNINFTAGNIYVFKITVEGDASFGNYQGEFKINSGNFIINQYPIFQPPLPITTGVNSIWQYYNTSTHPNVITSSVPELTQFYGDPNVKMVNIPGSGFNSIQLPWSIKYGDEFRFEGREDFVYQVGKIFGPADSGSGRLTQTGSIEVHFNYDLPVSASSSAFNLDHFSIRRYIDDPAQILMEGFRPTNSSGPYIIRPEYLVPELDRDVDSFILDLTQRGLL